MSLGPANPFISNGDWWSCHYIVRLNATAIPTPKAHARPEQSPKPGTAAPVKNCNPLAPVVVVTPVPIDVVDAVVVDGAGAGAVDGAPPIPLMI